MKKILVVDDHEIIRKGLKLSIEKEIENVQIDEAADENAALLKINEKEYDLLILDIQLGETNSIQFVNNLLLQKPHIKILIFSVAAEEFFAIRYLKLGVYGYLNKCAPITDIIYAINSTLQNKPYISTQVQSKLLENLISKAGINPFESLSAREFEIALLMLKGVAGIDICTQLNLSPSTIGTYKFRIFKKLNCKNLIQLSTLAKQNSVI